MSELPSVEGFTPEQLWGDAPPEWVAEAVTRYGPVVRIYAVSLTGDRIVVLAKFERGWRLSFRNPANPPEKRDLDFFLSPEASEAFLLLASLASYDDDPERKFPALQRMMAHMPAMEEGEMV